jgi:hypothetical protein
VNRAHAHREAAFYYIQSQLRRVNVSPGHRARRPHARLRLARARADRIAAVVGLQRVRGRVASNILTVSPAPTWGTNPHYIAIRTKTGRQFGPVLCTQGVDTAHIVLDAGDLSAVQTAQGMTLAAALARADGADDPSFDFGPGTRAPVTAWS